MPYYSELGIYTPSTSYTSPLLKGPYSGHSSIIASNILPPSSYSRTNFSARGFKPHLTTISESNIGGPLRKINSPKLIYHSSPKVRTPRPIKINTSDIDVSVNRYNRKYEQPSQKISPQQDRSSPKQEPSSTIKKDPTPIIEKEAKPNTQIRRDRATIRLQTIHKEKLENEIGQITSWRDNFKPEELSADAKRRKKSPGEILKEKFLIRSKSKENVSNLQPEPAKILNKSPSFKDICNVITTDQTVEDLNPFQPIEVRRRQSRQCSHDEILKEIQRSSSTLSVEEVQILDALLQAEAEVGLFNEPPIIEDKPRKKKAVRKKPTVDTFLEDNESRQSFSDNAIQDTSATRLRKDSSLVDMVKDISQVEIEMIPVKQKPVITGYIGSIEEKAKSNLKAVVDDLEIQESPKKKEKKFRFNVTVQEFPVKKKINFPKLELENDNFGVAQVPCAKKPVVNKILKKQEKSLRSIAEELPLTKKKVIKSLSDDKMTRKEGKLLLKKSSSDDMVHNFTVTFDKVKTDESSPANGGPEGSGKLRIVGVQNNIEKIDKAKIHKEMSIPKVAAKNDKEETEYLESVTLMNNNKIDPKPVTEESIENNKLNKTVTIKGVKSEKFLEKTGLHSTKSDPGLSKPAKNKLTNKECEEENKINNKVSNKEAKGDLKAKAIFDKTGEKNEKNDLQSAEKHNKVKDEQLNKQTNDVTTKEDLKAETLEKTAVKKANSDPGLVEAAEKQKQLKSEKLNKQISDEDQKPKTLLDKIGVKNDEEHKNLKNELLNTQTTDLHKNEDVKPKTILNKIDGSLVKSAEDQNELINETINKGAQNIIAEKDENTTEMSFWEQQKEFEAPKEQQKSKEDEINITKDLKNEIVAKDIGNKTKVTDYKKIEPNFSDNRNEEEKHKTKNLTKLKITPAKPNSQDVVPETPEEEQKRIISKRSLIQKANKSDPDLHIFEPPTPPSAEPTEPDPEPSFVPLQSNRLSQLVFTGKKTQPKPVEIYAKPKFIRARHIPRRWQQDSESEDSTTSEEDEDSTSEDEDAEEENQGAQSKIRASTSSDDSGFDSGKAKNKGSIDSRDSPLNTINPASNPAFALDFNDLPEEVSRSSTYQNFQRSGRITPPATTIPRFRKYCVDDFNFLKVLGKGSFGKVLLAELKETEYYYAIKCLKKDVVLEDDDVECTLIERKVLALGTKHPYLCHLLCTFQTQSHLFFVMEYLNGGDLMFHIQAERRFSEARARFYGAEIVSGLKFLHNKGIVYRDLKLDNILLDFDGHVRIADFGMCKLQIFLDRMADTFCGTPDYMAPEIIKGQHYNQCVDWWSFGVLLYEMLLGQSPFSGSDEDELFWSICNEKPVIPRFLSAEAGSVLLQFLEKDGNKRLGHRFSPHGDIQDHVFFKPIDWAALEARQLEPPFKPNLQHPLDTQYFDKTFTIEKAKLTPIENGILQSMDQTQFQGFSYTNPNATDK